MAVGLAALPTHASPAGPGEDFPLRPIRLLVAFPPGGVSDTLARILGQKMAQGMAQPVIIDNRPGASGTIGAEIAARALPDGYTLLHASMGQFAINPALFDRLPYDTAGDFTPVSLLATAPQLLMVHRDLPVRTVQELIDYARRWPGTLHIGSGRPGTLPHVGGELFRSLSGARMVDVPYKDPFLALHDLAGDRVQLVFADLPFGLPHAKAGKLRALAVTSASRSPLVPSLPAVAESGLPGYALVNWWGIVAPRALPGNLLALLNAELSRIHDLPDVRRRYAALGAEATHSTPGEFAAYIREEATRYRKVLKAAGVAVN